MNNETKDCNHDCYEGRDCEHRMSLDDFLFTLSVLCFLIGTFVWLVQR
jgi:hypothetical protein